MTAMSMQLLMWLGALVVPCVALWALRWAVRNDEFRLQERSALLPFSEEEPVGRCTDMILNQRTAKP